MHFSRVLLVEAEYPKIPWVPLEIQKDSSFYNANRIQIPLDLLYPAAVLEKNNVKVKVIDLNAKPLSRQELHKIVEEFNAELILVSSGYLNKWQCPPHPFPVKKTIKLLKELSNAVIGAFGPHSTALPDYCLSFFKSDFVIIGEPEETILSVCQNGISKSKGVAFNKNGKIIFNKPSKIINFEKLPPPNYSLIDLSFYKTGLIQSTRGCPANCIFCNKTMYGQGYRVKKPEKVIEEMRLLVEKGFDSFYFQDLDFCFDNDRTIKLCSLISKRFPMIAWSCTTRVTSVNLKVLKALKKAGCMTVNFGLESGSQKVLDNNRKGINLKQVRELITLCQKAKINAAFNIVFGMLGETKGTIKETLEFIKNHYGMPFVSIDRGHRVIAFPGSPLFETGVSEGKISLKQPYSDMYLSSGTIGTAFKTKNEFDAEFQKIRLNLLLFKAFRNPISLVRSLLNRF